MDPLGLVREVAAASQVHGDTSSLCGFNDLVVADGTARLNNGLNASFGQYLETVSEGEESVGSSHGTNHTLTCALYG